MLLAVRVARSCDPIVCTRGATAHRAPARAARPLALRAGIEVEKEFIEYRST